MKVDVETAATISRPVGDVADYAAEPSNAPTWYANIDSANWQTEPPLRVGSSFEFVAKFLGRTLRYTYEVIEFEPHSRLVMRTSQGPFPMQTTYSWEALTADSTRMTLRNTGAPAGFAKIVTPLMAPAMRRANRKDLAALKAILET